jgi:hypothetical protein
MGCIFGPESFRAEASSHRRRQSGLRRWRRLGSIAANSGFRPHKLPRGAARQLPAGSLSIVGHATDFRWGVGLSHVNERTIYNSI